MSQSTSMISPPTRMTLPGWGSPWVITVSPAAAASLAHRSRVSSPRRTCPAAPASSARAGSANGPPLQGRPSSRRAVSRSPRQGSPISHRATAGPHRVFGIFGVFGVFGVHPVQRGQHRHQLVAVRRGEDFTAPARDSAQEREHGDRVPGAERPQRLTVQRRYRGHDEPEGGLAAEGHGGIHRRSQAREDGGPGPSEPSLVIQVIDRDELSFALVVADHPVVASAAHRRVPQGRGADAPAVGQGVTQVSFRSSLRACPSRATVRRTATVNRFR